jgi:DNA-binding PadR family transcriptional regulator
MQRDDARLGEPAYLVLGMIRLGARSGYEIKQMVEASIRFFWTISQAQIYPSLELLKKRGLVEGKSEPLGKRRRQTFVITAAGEAALRDWLGRAEPMPFELRDIAMVKLFFADALDRNQADALLGDVERRSQAQIVTLGAIEPAARGAADHGNVYPMLTLRMGMAFHRAMIEVCETFKAEGDQEAAKRGLLFPPHRGEVPAKPG